MKLCREKKWFLSGKQVTYDCELVALCSQFGILKYLADRPYQVGSLTLGPDTVSYGFYWPDRPYVLYKWFNGNGDAVGHYFSLADSVTLSAQEFSWCIGKSKMWSDAQCKSLVLCMARTQPAPYLA